MLTAIPTGRRGTRWFPADLTIEPRASPQQTWTAIGTNPETALLAVVDHWRAGQLKGSELGGVSAEDARALGRPVMGYLCKELRSRLARETSRQYLRWLHPTSRQPGDTFLQPTASRTGRQHPIPRPSSDQPKQTANGPLLTQVRGLLASCW